MSHFQAVAPLIEITLQYFDGCPNWQTTAAHLHRLLEEGLDAHVAYELIDSHEMALDRGFPGSPTVLINGVDPFGHGDLSPALACRIYQTENGNAGSPSLAQLRRVTAF